MAFALNSTNPTMEKSSGVSNSSPLPIEFQITRRKRSDFHHYYKARNFDRSAITEEEKAAHILIMMSQDKSFLKYSPPKSKFLKPSPPKSKPQFAIKSAPKSTEFPIKSPSVSKVVFSVGPKSVLGSASSSHECSTCGKTFPSHQALGGHKTMHNRPNLKRKRSDSEVPLVNGVLPVLENSGTVRRSKSEAPLVPVREKLSFKLHVCKECSKVFPTGQALGGHMREHFKGEIPREKKKKVEFLHDKTQLKSRISEPETVAEVPPLIPVVNGAVPAQALEKKVKFEFDLNLPPEMQSSDCEKNNGGAGAAN